MVVFIAIILASLVSESAKATSLLNADRFTPTYVCSKKEAIGLSTRLTENPNNQNIPRENRAIYERRSSHDVK